MTAISEQSSLFFSFPPGIEDAFAPNSTFMSRQKDNENGGANSIFLKQLSLSGTSGPILLPSHIEIYFIDLPIKSKLDKDFTLDQK